MFACSARDRESLPAASITNEVRAEHRAFVAAAIMQSSAGLEAEVSEIMLHGPGYHLVL
jgi:hypothetical protein